MFRYEEAGKEDWNGGVKYIFKFNNQYGASVIGGNYPYWREKDKWELAVIHWNSKEWERDYSVPIMDNILDNLTVEEVNELLDEIRLL